jgi:hypothetical protein
MEADVPTPFTGQRSARLHRIGRPGGEPPVVYRFL